MPKQRITKETVVNAAFEIARNSGMEQVMVKNIADKIGCSVQPIYSYCKNMEGLRQDVVDQVGIFIRKYVAEHIDHEDLFASTGRAYICLAKEEPFLFKIFILHQRKGVSSLKDLYEKEAGGGIKDKRFQGKTAAFEYVDLHDRHRHYFFSVDAGDFGGRDLYAAGDGI